MKFRFALSKVRRGNGTASEIVSRCLITRVAYALTGIEPHRTAGDTIRTPATWRGGNDLNISLDDSRGVWHDFATDEGGGILDLLMRVLHTKRIGGGHTEEAR